MELAMLRPLIQSTQTTILIAFVLLCCATLARAESSPTLSFSVIKTAQSAGGLEATLFDDGSWFKVRKLVHCAVLVRHPKGDFLYDTGMGTAVETQMSSFGFLDRQLFKIEALNPAITQLTKAAYDPKNLMAIIPGHMHWDHASGIEDFPGVPVWIQNGSLDEAKTGHAPAFLKEQFDAPEIRWQTLTLKPESYLGFSPSLDLFGDGSVVLVDLSGHTVGQVGMFLTLPDGSRYFFIGDTTWVLEGITTNSSRPWITHKLAGVDHDIQQNARVIQKIHDLAKSDPALMIVPAHDENVLKTLPVYPQFR